MTPMCDLPTEDLVAYADGELPAPRREFVAAHLRDCPACRQRLADFREVDRLLRAASPPLDDPAGRAALRARLAVEATRHSRPPRSRRVLVAVPLLLALLIVSGIVSSRTEADWRHVFRLATPPGRATAPAGQAPPGTRVTGVQPATPGAGPVAFPAVEPARLPFGLALAGQSTPHPERRELLYRSPDGLVIRLVQVPARGPLDLPDGQDRTITVGDTAVRWLRDPRPGAVSGLLWERRGVVFELLVLAAPAGGLPLEDARQIAAALMTAQEVAR